MAVRLPQKPPGEGARQPAGEREGVFMFHGLERALPSGAWRFEDVPFAIRQQLDHNIKGVEQVGENVVPKRIWVEASQPVQGSRLILEFPGTGTSGTKLAKLEGENALEFLKGAFGVSSNGEAVGRVRAEILREKPWMPVDSFEVSEVWVEV